MPPKHGSFNFQPLKILLYHNYQQLKGLPLQWDYALNNEQICEWISEGIRNGSFTLKEEYVHAAATQRLRPLLCRPHSLRALTTIYMWASG